MSDLITITRRSQPKPGLLTRIGRALRGTWVGPFSLKDAKDPALKAALQRIFGDGYESAAGVTVTRENAFTFSAVFDAVNQISSDVAKLPLNLHKRRQGGGSDHYVESTLYHLLKHEPNPEQASMVFRRTLVAHALTCHGGYAEIERDKIGRPLALWTLTPDRVEPIRRPARDSTLGPLEYRIDGSDAHIIPARDMIHIHGLGYDGYIGYEVINKARQAIGLALAAEKFGSQYFSKGTVFGGWLETDEDLDEEQKAAIRNWIQDFRSQQDSAFRVLVTEMGRKFHQFTSKPSDSQMDELRVRQVEEVARFFRMPPHRLGVNTPGTVSYASVEAANLDYYTGALLDWITLVEQEFNRKLIPRLERRQQFIKHNVNAFLRGTIKDRYEALGIARDKGVINADEWRDLEDMNPQEGGQGSLYLVQSAQVPLNKLEALADAEIKSRTAKSTPPDSTPPAPAPTNTPDGDDQRDVLIADLRERLASAESIVAEAQHRAADLRQHIAAAEAAGTVKDETIAILRESERTQQELAASTLAIVAGLRTELEAAQAARAHAESEARAQTVLVQALTAERDAAVARVTEATAERDRLVREAEQARGAADDAATLVEAIATDKNASDAARRAAEQQAQELQQRADVAAAALLVADTRVSELERTQAEAEQRLTDFSAQLEHAQQHASDLEQTCTALRQQVDTLEGAHVAGEAERSQLRDALAALERERDEARAAVAQREAEAAAEATRRTELEAALEAQRRAQRDRLAGVITAHRGLIVDALGRMTRRECQQARSKHATPEKLRRWLESFPTLHEAICVEALTPAIRTHLAWKQSTADPVTETERLVREHIAAFVAQVRTALEADPEEFHAVLDRVLTRWETERPAVLADAVLAEEIRYVREQ